MKRIFLLLFIFLVSCTNPDNTSAINEGDELWVMIKTNTYFRQKNELAIIDTIAAVIESEKLGYLDGHSSGGYQFDFNFIEVKHWYKAKSKVEEAITKNYPNIEYTISNTYETTYDKL